MERVDPTTTARCTLIVEAAPQDLRMVADRLELAEKNCLPGQEIIVPLTGSIVLLYRPQVKSYAASGLLDSTELASHSETPTHFN